MPKLVEIVAILNRGVFCCALVGENESSLGSFTSLVRFITRRSKSRSGAHSRGRRASVISSTLSLKSSAGCFLAFLRAFDFGEDCLEVLGIFLQKVLRRCM